VRQPVAPLATSLTLLALVAFPLAVRAQGTGQDTDTDLQDFLPLGGPREFLTVPSPAVSPHRSVGFGLIVNYVHEPLTLVDLDGNEVLGVGHQVTADFLWSFGLWDRLQLGLALPVVVSQDGEGIAPIACPDPADCEIPELAATAIRDIRLDAKLRFGKTGVASALGAAVVVSLPTGDDQNFAGSNGASVTPMLTFGGLRALRQVRLGAALGGRIRGETEVADAKFGSELWARVGAGYEVVPRLALSAEYFGTLPLTDGAHERMELLGAVRYSPDRAEDVTVELGAGAGISDSAGSPAFRAIAGVSYAPLGRDTDSDGVLDRADACLTRAEDRDGFEDADGCPDPDNDGDDVADGHDGCDDEAEDADGFQDADGCPDPDNDEDGVADADDQCPTDAEDQDEFEDEDGCMEEDNDGDSIPDVRDACANEPEDVDGFEDDNGCPEPDNDGDGLPDVQDGCPGDAEDRDGNADADGCPDPDDDQDGVLDASDRCAGESETINGRDDDDGCPDPGAVAFTWQADVLSARRGPRFAAGASTMPPRSEAIVAQLVQNVRARVGARIVVSGFGDRPVEDDAQRTLARARAEAIKAALVAGGVAAARIEVQVGTLTTRRGAAPQWEIRATLVPVPRPAPPAAPPPPAAPAPAPAQGATP